LIFKPTIKMTTTILAIAFTLSFAFLPARAQTPTPKPPAKVIVTAAQVNGVYRSYENEFRILALGHGKLKVQFDGVYRTISKSVNTGYAAGEATIDGNVATLELPDFGACKINLVFLPRNRLKVIQEGDSPDCGFGHNVRADGTYRKIRGGKPKFEEPPE
jgi:hypothetical protein